jgi:hypothetical protein
MKTGTKQLEPRSTSCHAKAQRRRMDFVILRNRQQINGCQPMRAAAAARRPPETRNSEPLKLLDPQTLKFEHVSLSYPT